MQVWGRTFAQKGRVSLGKGEIKISGAGHREAFGIVITTCS